MPAASWIYLRMTGDPFKSDDNKPAKRFRGHRQHGPIPVGPHANTEWREICL